MSGWINVGDTEHIQASVSSMKADVDAERNWLAATKRPIQPDGQVWPLAIALVDAWDHRLLTLEQWYEQRSASLASLEVKLRAAQVIHRDTEESAADLSREAMG
jgi:hypothetical protein